MILDSLTVLKKSNLDNGSKKGEIYTSKDSFQYGFNVFLMTEVVFVCSPSTVNTANGSGNPKSKFTNDQEKVRKTSRLVNPSAAITIIKQIRIITRYKTW